MFMLFQLPNCILKNELLKYILTNNLDIWSFKMAENWEFSKNKNDDV